MFETRVGDLFNQDDKPALAQGVNCKGDMGGGIAVIFRKKWPDMYNEYKEHCDSGGLVPGGVVVWNDGETVIFNIASQNNPGPDAREDWLKTSLNTMLNYASNNSIDRIAVPLIGGGIGGLDPDNVRKIIRDMGESYDDVTLVLVKQE